MNLDLLVVSKKKDCAASLFAEHLEKRRNTAASEAVRAPGGHDPHLTWTAEPRLSVDLDQDLPLQYVEDLVGVVVAMKVTDVVRCDGLHPHDESSQPVLGSGEHADVGGPGRKRHDGSLTASRRQPRGEPP